MLLFKKNWENFPSAIVDLDTNNTSFVRYAGLLKSMGVSNHSFCLALINPELKGVDPRSNNLSPDQIAMIVKECRENPWYIFREVIKLPPSGGSQPMHLEANRGNIALFWLFFNHVTSLLIQPRQTGKSVSTDTLMVSLMNLLTINTNIHLLTKDDSLRVSNVKRIKEIVSYLPYYLKLKNKTDTNNSEKITVNRLGNAYLTSVPQASIKAAQNIGRGLTVAIHHIDEIAFINNIDKTLPALLATGGAARDNAKKEGAPYGTIFTTTAGYLNTDSGAFVKTNIYNKALRWTEQLFDCVDEEDLHKTIRMNSPSRELQVLLEFNHRQLGKTDEWVKSKIADAVSKGENAGADFLNMWADGGSESAIDKKILARIHSSQVNDAYNEISTYGYITRWYLPKHEVMGDGIFKRKLVMGLDTSDAVGNDDISMVIRDAITGETIATGNYNETNTILFSKWIGDWLIKYKNLTLVIERRSTGTSILDNLLLILPSKEIDPFKRIFNWVTDLANENKEYYEVINTPMTKRSRDVYTKYRKEFGYATSGSGKASRDNLYGEALNASTTYTAEVTRDPTLIYQISRLIKKNGRIDHRAGDHDDSVIAWLLGYWFLSKAKNKHHYGLNASNVLSAVNTMMIKEQGGPEVIRMREERVYLKNKISELMKDLELDLPTYKKKVIINLIHKLNDELGDEANHDLNIDNLLRDVGKVKPDSIQEKELRPYRIGSTFSNKQRSAA